MSGKPAARQGDMTQYGGPIVQGSAGVRIGAPTGVACSVCPGGVTSGNPVNPLLGAKVLPGETDFALPGPLPFILSRTYSSYRTKTPAPVGIFGPGWKAPSDIHLQLRDNELILNDNGGRSIHFEHLFPGEDGFSRSELFWLVRGGVAKLNESHRLAPLWQALPEELRLSPHIYLATNSPQGPWWILGWSERVPGVDEMLPAPLPPYRVLTGLVDRFGRTLTFRREAAGEFTGEITGVTDGAGRQFRLVLTTQAQRAENARQQAIAAGAKGPDIPDSLPDYTEYGRDNGIRLSAVWLTHDPEYPENLPAAPLVRYDWTPRGELAAVYDRSGTQMRHFTYDDKYRGRMVAHRYAGRPEMRYRYDDTGRVTEQFNPAGLSYAYQYEKNRITITDSLNRREVLHTEGEAGLKRVVKTELADGSITRSKFDYMGRLQSQTDAAGRTTEYSPNVVTGLVTCITTPDGRKSEFYYNNQNQLTSATGPDGLEMRRKYDEYGRLTQETARNGDVTRYSYDNPHSELPSATEDATGSRKQMTWSRYGQLQTFTDCSGYETHYEYDRFGQMMAVHREEGISTYNTYNPRGQLVSWKDTQGRETQYEYNAAGDLTAVITPDGNRSETLYDAWGKAVSTTQGGLTRSMEYDAAGRVISLTNENGSHTEFSWDVLDRLIQQRGFDGRTQRYRYDLTGKLTQSEDEGLITLWHYDASDRITHRTVNGEPAEQWRYNDHRGLPLALISTEGATEWRGEYDEWGNQMNEENPHHLFQPYRLPGQQYDDESGLCYNRNRYYDPLQGRYITQDPIGLSGGWNLYQYPLNPVHKVDPLGLSAWDDAKSGACHEGICRLFSVFIGPDKFDSTDDAAFEALKKTNGHSICQGVEHAGLVCKDKNNKYFYTPPKQGNVNTSYPFESPCPNGTETVAMYHTHGSDSNGVYGDEVFSPADKELSKNKAISSYLGTPKGSFQKVEPNGDQPMNKSGLPSQCRVHANGEIY